MATSLLKHSQIPFMLSSHPLTALAWEAAPTSSVPA
jgi:hypothetical protein